MKFLCLVLTLMMIFSTINNLKIRRRLHRYRAKTVWGNLWCFGVGAVGTLIGKPDMDPANVLGPIKACIPKEWGGSKGSSEETAGFSYMKNNNSIIKKILDLKYKAVCVWGHCAININVDKIVNTLCKYLTKAIQALGRRRFRRRFLQIRNGRRRRMFIARTLRRVRAKRWSLISKVLGAASGLLKPLLTKVKTFIINMIQKIPIVKKIMDTFKCLQKLAQGIVNTVKRRITGFVNAVKTILTKGWIGFVTVILKAVCQWSTFKRAIKDLVDAFSNTGCKRWKLIGNFVGGFAAAIGDGN